MQALCSKLKAHWTNIAHHLYLKAEAPVPLPAVGPLAELLTVTRNACQEMIALAAAGKLTAADISTALDTNTVRLLGRLVQWLQAEPSDQHLLNTERSESLWQLLLLTLANLLKVLQPEEQEAVPDMELVDRFKQQLQSSGVLGADSADGGSGSSSSTAATPAAEPVSSGLIPTLQWLVQHHPHRCLTASMGAWLLLIELSASSGPPAPAADAAGGSTAAAAGAPAQSQFPAAPGMLLPLGQVLQAYVDCGYRTMARPPAAPLSQAAGGSATSGRNSGSGTPVRRMNSREQVDSSSSSPTPGKKRSATPAAAGAADDGCPSPAGGDGKAAGEAADADAVLKGYSHAVCLSDDPNSAVFKHLLVLLHSLQTQLLVLAATVGPPQGLDEQESSLEAAAAGEGGLQLPHATNCQVLAMANAWLLQHSESTAAAAAAAGGREYEHQSLLPAPALAVEALKEAGMDSLAAVQQLVELCAKALQLDCIRYMHALQQRQRQQQKAAAGEGSSSSSDPKSSSSSNGVEGLDTSQVYRLVLDAVCLQQACGAAVSEETLTAVALAARCSTRAQVQQLLQQRGSQLLHAMHKYVQQEPEQQAEAAATGNGDASASGSSAAASADTWEAGLQDLSLARRCVACAGVLMEICSSGRMRVDDRLLGCLTETDPAKFYSIMDLLVRKVHPDSLMQLLPMSGAFLAHDISSAQERRLQQQQQQDAQGGEAGPSSPSKQQGRPSSSGPSSSQDPMTAMSSLVILNDPDVCRTFAAAVHGYCKTALAHLQDTPAGGGCSGGSCGHDHDHDHDHHHHHHHSVAAVLPPLQQVAGWLLFTYDFTVQAAEDSSYLQELAAADAAAAAAGSAAAPAPNAGSECVVASVSKHAKQLQSVSQAAAGSLVMTILLARAAAPLLQWVDTQLKQLEPAAAAAAADGASSSSSSSSSSGDGAKDLLLPLTTGADIWACMHFVRCVWQAVTARYMLSQVLEEQLSKLFKAANAAAAATAALGKQAGGSKGAAAEAAAAAADAQRVAKGLKIAAVATQDALHGRRLARGWSHLAFLMPQAALRSARDFQTTWPGDIMKQPKAMAVVAAAREQLYEQLTADSSGGSAGSSSGSAVRLPAAMQQELLKLVADAQRMLGSVMDEIPLPVGCNNPSCDRMEAVAEATLSINKRCSQCLAAHYCCKSCQTVHWPQHKAACKRLRQQAPQPAAKAAP